jgi:hypothetical protein
MKKICIDLYYRHVSIKTGDIIEDDDGERCKVISIDEIFEDVFWKARLTVDYNI